MFNKRLKRINQKMAEILFENIKYTVKLSMDNQKLKNNEKEYQKALMLKDHEINKIKKENADLKDTLSKDQTHYLSIEGHLFAVTRYDYTKEAGSIPTIVVSGIERVNTSMVKETTEVLD